MAELLWVAWLPLEGCFKAIGKHVTWFVHPSGVDSQWSLESMTNSDHIIQSEDRGVFPSLEAAKDAAYRLEVSMEPGTGN